MLLRPVVSGRGLGHGRAREDVGVDLIEFPLHRAIHLLQFGAGQRWRTFARITYHVSRAEGRSAARRPESRLAATATGPPRRCALMVLRI